MPDKYAHNKKYEKNKADRKTRDKKQDARFIPAFIAVKLIFNLTKTKEKKSKSKTFQLICLKKLKNIEMR